MTGIERLRAMAERHNFLEPEEASKMWDIADQIEREQDATVADSPYDALPPDERDAIAWVREHGGIATVKEEWNHSRNLKRQFETAQAKVERQQRHIEFVQRKCRERQEHVCELNKLKRAYVDALNGVCKRLGLTDGTGLPDMPEIILTELDRRLMPEGMEWLVEAWPRFEDDAPVRFLDDFERYGEENGVSAVTMYSDGSFALNFRAYWKGEHVNRPAPKVLDADGVEIREKGDVWWICDGDDRGIHAERLRVETIGPNGLIECSPYNGGTWVYLEPSELYVNKPVLAADGKPLREGETVWSVDSGTRYTVEKITDELIPIKCCSEMGSTVSLHPSQLTHERPESKCRDCKYWQKDPTADNMGVCWFLYHEYEGEDCYAARTGGRDACEEFVRRAERLAERGR